MKTHSARYLRSARHEKGLEMFFAYRGEQYSIIRAATYPESEYQQHQDEQNRIDTKLILAKRTEKSLSIKEALEVHRATQAEFKKAWAEATGEKEE